MYKYQQDCKIRREILLDKIGVGNATVIHANQESKNFYYLTSFCEVDAVAVFIPGRQDGEFILFNKSQDETRKLWHGDYLGQDIVCSEFGVHQAFSVEKISEILPLLLDNYNELNMQHIIYQMRNKKSSVELDLLRRAIEVTKSGFLRAIKSCRPDMYEFELEAELIYEFKRNSGCNEAFPTIVGGGKNACILHYDKNSAKLLDNELVLIDAGAVYKNYCADVTRTIPINGKFSSKQRNLYNLVLDAQLEVINNIRPGVKISNLQEIARKVLKKNSCEEFFVHKISHFLGLDVHDVGVSDILLEPGMVLTVEPGIYIESENIGIRIEDDILVTDCGCEVLTQDIPKTVDELESIMN